MSGFLRPDSGRVFFAGEDITGRRAPERPARHDPHFQIVQPFAAQTVRENIAVAPPALRQPREALARAEAVAQRVGLGALLAQPPAS
jgi:branched-chain amino acid transport system ATP-binding protein